MAYESAFPWWRDPVGLHAAKDLFAGPASLMIGSAPRGPGLVTFHALIGFRVF